MALDPATLTGTYFRAWKEKDFTTLRSVLTWFDLHTTIAAPAPTANWSHIENGKIATIRVIFDARPLAPKQDQ